jgi:hypothetical protein
MGGSPTAAAPATAPAGGASPGGGTAGASGGATAAGAAGAAVGVTAMAATTAVKTSSDIGKRGGKAMQDLAGNENRKPEDPKGPTQRGPRAGDT